MNHYLFVVNQFNLLHKAVFTSLFFKLYISGFSIGTMAILNKEKYLFKSKLTKDCGVTYWKIRLLYKRITTVRCEEHV